MGEVYRARDRKLDRDVAVKVLPDSVSKDPHALARFEKEAKAVAALSHPNILSIHDFGTQDGTAYAVMELLEGDTLRGKLESGAVSQKQAVDLALQVARGLSAAHDKGVVHRDLKPENLFVTKDGHVKILDFGLAKRVETAHVEEQTSAPTGTGQTAPGTVMGTVGYMSPEQVRGLPVDHRSDIFSFGAILYELLSGQHAFLKGTASDTMASILRDEPQELTQSGRSVPIALDHIVTHCLEKDRDSRFQSARDIAFALTEASNVTGAVSGAHVVASLPGKRRVWIAGAAVAAVVIVAAGLFLLKGRGRVEPGGVKRIAVLPFENLGAPEDDYFADGIADQVRGKLTALPGIEVIARASSTPYKKTTKSPQEIARELSAGYLLTATVRWQKSGETSRVQVSPELVEIRSDAPPASRWQQAFDASMTDVFHVQSDIASKVAQSLGVALGTGEQKRLSESPTQNLAAYDALLKGDEATNGNLATDPSSLRKALGFYEQAVALDPGFAQAWSRIASVSSLLYANSTPTPELSRRAREAAEKAVALAPDRPEGYLALGTYQRVVVLDFGRALEAYARGQRLAPANVELLRGAGLTEMTLGRWDLAVEHLRRAERLDPRRPGVALATALLWLRRYREARDTFDRNLALAPADLGLIQGRAMTFLGEGDLAGARSVLEAAPAEVAPSALVAYFTFYWDLSWVLDEARRDLVLRLTPDAFYGDRGIWGICLTQVFALKGDTANVRVHAEEARRAFAEQLREVPNDAPRHAILGLSLAFLGRKEEAIREGQRAAELLPVSRDANVGPYLQHQLIWIYILVGEHEKALDHLEQLLKVPYYVSPRWLAIDPNFSPLRSNPRFQKLVAGA
jgi:TolB-like protein/tetratricopeptide (TPR) repeat protein